MSFEYTVVGAGPSGIIAIVRILEKLFQDTQNCIEACRLAKKVCWIDDHFSVGAFGQQWKNVPGNTTAAKYQTVYKEMYTILKLYGISKPSFQFELDLEEAHYTSLLKTAAEPLLWMTEQLMKIITPIKGKATKAISSNDGLEIDIQTKTQYEKIHSKKCILAIGGEAKIVSTMPTHQKHKIIPLEIALDLILLNKFIEAHPALLKRCILVQGSSHSAALAVWNLLACGATVKQIMNKPYNYYRSQKNPDGTTRVYYENDGLKGKVAEFTLALESGKIFADKWSCEIHEHANSKDFSTYDFVIFAIGLQPVNSLTINEIPSSALSYNLHTSETRIPGVFVVGAGYPLLASDGSKNVGISKFWPDMGKAASTWHEKPVKTKSLSDYYPTFGLLADKSFNNFPLPVAPAKFTARL